MTGQNAACWLGVPLSSKYGTIGALIVKSLPGGERYTEQDKELLQYVCAQVRHRHRTPAIACPAAAHGAI
jgi:hypothetical protein